MSFYQLQRSGRRLPLRHRRAALRCQEQGHQAHARIASALEVEDVVSECAVEVGREVEVLCIGPEPLHHHQVHRHGPRTSVLRRRRHRHGHVLGGVAVPHVVGGHIGHEPGVHYLPPTVFSDFEIAASDVGVYLFFGLEVGGPQQLSLAPYIPSRPRLQILT